MPRYFFHVDNGVFTPDRSGTELTDHEAAQVEAIRAAGEMIDETKESFWEHMTPWNMHVTDSDHRLLFTLQFAAKIPSGHVLYVPEKDN